MSTLNKIKNMKRQHLLQSFFILLLLFFNLTNQATLSQGIVEVQPSQINQVSTLKFQEYIFNEIPAQGSFKIVFPKQITSIPSADQCQMVIPFDVQVTCTAELVNGHIQIIAKLQQAVADYFLFQIPNVLNPSSTAETDSFELFTYDANGQLLDSQTTSIILQATRGALQAAQIVSSSNVCGDFNNDIVVTLRTSNPVPIDGKVSIKFPYWNPEATGTIYRQYSYMVSPSNIVCVPSSGNPLKSQTSIPCTFDSSTQTLTLSNLFSQAVTSNQVFSFVVKGVKNPITTQPVSTIEISTIDNSPLLGTIDWSYSTMLASQPGKIVTTTIKPDSSLVQQLTPYRLEFVVPVPLSQGCIIEIVFPSTITLGSELQSVVAFGMPNAQRTLTGVIDRTRNSYVISNACPSYRDNTNTAIVIFSSITNPFYQVTTEPLQIYISDAGQRLVCQTYTGAGPSVTTVTGSIGISPVFTDATKIINQIDSVTFTIKPQHALLANSQITVTLPAEFTLASKDTLGAITCKYTGISSNMSPMMQECEYRVVGGARMIVISNALLTDYQPSQSSQIQFKVHNLQLPPSESPTGAFSFTVGTFYDGAYHFVDTGSMSNLFQAIRTTLGGGSVVSDSLMANAISTYTFTIQVTNPILPGGSIVINLPSEVTIPTLSNAKCVNPSTNFPNVPSCQFNSTSIMINNGFNARQFEITDGSLLISVAGLLNPRSLKASSSFQMFSYDSKGYMIEYKLDQMAMQMVDTNLVQQALVQPSVQVVAQQASYLFTIRPATPLITGDVISITFPNEFNVPIINTLKSCTGGSGMNSATTCKPNGPHGLLLTASFPVISQSQTISFTVLYIINPPSTDPTGVFKTEILDSSGALINQNDPMNSGYYVQMQQGALIKNITVINQSRKSLTMTAFTFTLNVDVRIPINAQIFITYPTQITANEVFLGCQLSNKDPDTSCVFNTIKNTVNITQVTSVPIEAGTVFQVTLYGLINSQYAAATNSFTFEVKSQAGNQVMYAKSGLTVTNDCDYPCLTCQQGSPSKCLTCETDSIFSLFLNGQCLRSCPSNYYPSSYQCLQCDRSCAECADGGKSCTKCFKGTYLQGNTCVNSCLAGVEYQNETASLCQACQAPCATCTKSTQICDSCLTIGPQTIFYMNKCLNTCPAQTTVEIEKQCVNCSSNCKTCSGLPSVCTSCQGTQKLDMTDSTCKDSCPVGTTVETAGNMCFACDPTCKTCATSSRSYCLSCQYGLNFYETSHQCLVTCPNKTLLITEKNVPYCRDCDYGCLECQNKTNYCTKCDPNHVFYKFNCIDSCPSGYKTISDSRKICVLERDNCKYGYEYNDFGECALVVQVCDPGYILNTSLNKCIPVPGFYIPLIFLIVAGAWTVYLLILFKKGKIEDNYQLITQLLIGYTFIQTFTYFLMFCLSISLDYKLVTAIHLTTLFSMLITNMGFGLYVHIKLRKNDQTFRYFADREKKGYSIIKWAMMIYSFKSSRIFFAQLRFRGRALTVSNAPFENRYLTVVKPLFITTVVNFIVQAGPIVLMDAYNLMFIPWGYQIMVMSIDNMILALVIFVLEIVEFAYFKRLATEKGEIIDQHNLGGGRQFLKKGDRQINVMSGLPDFDDRYGDDDEGDLSQIQVKVGNSMSNQELMALESMYLTREGYKKSVLSRMEQQQPASLQTIESQRIARNKKFLDPDDAVLAANLSSNLPGRKTQGHSQRERTNEAKLLENLVRQMNEHHKFNQLHSEPSEPQLQLDPETKALMGDINDKKLMDASSKRKLKLESTRERIENNLSCRSLNQKSSAQLANERVLNEMHKALFGGTVGGVEGLQNLNGIQSLHRDGISFAEIREAINLESARTEKFNKYEGDQSQHGSYIRHSLGLLDAADNQSQEEVILFELTQVERDKKDFALYYKEARAIQIKEKKERSKLVKKRRCHSFEGLVMREWWDDMGPMSDFESQLSRDSLPHGEPKYKQAEYIARLELFRQHLKNECMFNNVYAQAGLSKKKKDGEGEAKAVTRRTQTYEKDIAVGYDPFNREGEDFITEEDKAIEFDPGFANKLFQDLIDNISDLPSSNGLSLSESLSGGPKKRRKRRNGKFISKDNFEIDDIMGDLDLDDNGNLIFPSVPEKELEEARRKRGKEFVLLKDKQGRLINKHGYLIDKRGNVLNEDGELMFEFMELDSEEDLPQPYKFEKRRKVLLSRHSGGSFKHGMTVKDAEAKRHLFDIDSVVDNEDEQLEEEFNRLRQMSRPSSVDSLIGDKPEQQPQKQGSEGEQNGPPKTDKKSKEQEEEEVDEEELWNTANRKERRLAKAYGGKPLSKQKKKKTASKVKKSDAVGQSEEATIEQRPPTDRLYPSLLQREEERVKKIAMVAYRQGLSDNDQAETAEGAGFQQFFKRQMEELEINRQMAREEFNRNQVAALDAQASQETIKPATAAQGDIMRDSFGSQFWTQSHSQVKASLPNGFAFANQQQELINEDDELRMVAEDSVQQFPRQNRDLHQFISQAPDQVHVSSVKQLAMNSSSALTTFNNLNFNVGSQSTINQVASTGQRPPLPADNNMSGRPTSGQYRWPPMFYPQSSNSIQQNGVATIEETQAVSIHNYNQRSQGRRVQQSMDEEEVEAKPAFKKFDFYLPTQKGPKVKKNLQKQGQQLNFSEVGQMQLGGNNRIKDLEKLYLQKYPGHQQANSTLNNMNNMQKSAQHFNQYVNNVNDQQAKYTNIVANFAPIRKKTPGSMRGEALSVSNDSRPQSSAFYQGRQQSFTNQGYMNPIKLKTTNRDNDVFEGIAKVLNNIERLKSSDGGHALSSADEGAVAGDTTALINQSVTTAPMFGGGGLGFAGNERDVTTQMMSSTSTQGIFSTVQNTRQ